MFSLKKCVLFSFVTLVTSTLAYGQAVKPQTDAPQVQKDTSIVQDQVASFMAGRLLLRNHANIELATLAKAKSNNEKTKALAQRIITDCQSLNDKLQSLAPQSIVQSIVANKREKRTDSTETSRVRSAKPATGAMVGSNTALFELSKLEQQMAASRLDLAKQYMSKLESDEFDKSYIEHQAMCCQLTQAEIKTLKGIQSPKFQEVLTHMKGCLAEHVGQIKQAK